MMTPREIAERIVVTLDNKKGKDIRLLKTEAVTVLADYFVLCTGTGATHLKTLVEEVDKALEKYKNEDYTAPSFTSEKNHPTLVQFVIKYRGVTLPEKAQTAEQTVIEDSSSLDQLRSLLGG